MKKLLISLVAVIVWCNVSGQAIMLKNRIKSSIETAGDIKLEASSKNNVGKLILKDISIKCKTLSIGKNIAKLKIKGSVRIECERVDFETVNDITVFFRNYRPSILTVEESGNIFLEYKNRSIYAGRNLEMKIKRR